MAFHTRSNSFPSRPHPVVEEIDEHLCRLRSFEATSASSSSVSHKLSSLQDLYDDVDRFLQLPLTQQAVFQEQNQKSTNELSDDSLLILDVCSTAKDAILQTKECVQELQSIIRRRRRGEIGLTNEVRKYLTSRKMVKKTIQQAMKNLKGIEKEQETISIASKLRDVEAVTLTVIESLLSFISGLKPQPNSWSLVSKMMQSKRVACEEETNEFAQVDAALDSLIGHNKTRKPHPQGLDNVQNQLEKLQSCIQGQEEGIECLFRHLIKTRVSLLNILNR